MGEPARCRRPPRPSKLDPFREEIDRSLRADPRLPGKPVREVLEEQGYAGGKTILDDYLREVRPPLPPRPRTFQRISYRPGALCQFDLWEPSRHVGIGISARDLPLTRTTRAWRRSELPASVARRRPTLVDVTFEEAQQLVALGESETQEFKQTTGQRTESAHTLVGMLHRHGGRVWFGVTPRAEPVGQDVSDKTLEDLAAVYRDIEPTVYPSIERIPTPTGRELISVRVERGPMPPYSFRGKSWTRSGTMNQELEVEERNRMLVERLHGSRRWENEVAEGWTVDDLDDDEIARTVTIAAERGRLGEIGSRDPRVLLERLRLVAHDGAVLRAAVVLFGDRHKIEATYPQCQLRVGKLRETISGGFGDLRHLYGSAFRLLEIAEEFIRENTPKPGRLIPGVFERADDPFYPPLALREALANALCHRDYSIGGGAVTIRLHADNRLEIISSGGLHFGLTRDALFRPHDSKPWNPLIADVFYRRGLIDSFGTGIERMTEQMRQAGLPTPDIDDVGGSVIVALSPPEKSREERIIDVVRRQGAITTSEAMAVIGASRATAKRLLTNLADEGQLELRGKGRKSHYVLP